MYVVQVRAVSTEHIYIYRWFAIDAILVDFNLKHMATTKYLFIISDPIEPYIFKVSFIIR